MPSICGKITAALSMDCDNPLQAGTESTLILVNRADWLDGAFTYNATNAQIIESVTLATGIQGYAYEGRSNSIGAKYELIKNPYSEVYNHEISFKVSNVTPLAKEELEKMAKGSMVAIVHNKFKSSDGSGAYEVYGAGAGLVVTQNIRDVINQDNQGAFDIILKSSDLSPEVHMPMTYFITDFATTKTAVETILTPAA
tara:strand:+ start:6690 stop:7283 length:594 start_codon:yes stop_codon:yes gene_type:complete